MIANAITLSRLLLTFIVIPFFKVHPILDMALITTIALIFILDAVDGIVARKRNETSAIGALLDTIADRVIENIFWIYFTAVGHISVWIPIAVMTRGIFTDCLQGAFVNTPKIGWAHALTRSRISRALYGTVKMFAFIGLATTYVFRTPVLLQQVSLILITFAVVFCLVRALPALVEVFVRIEKTGRLKKQFSLISRNTEEFTESSQIPKEVLK